MSLWSRFERRINDLADGLVLDDYRDQLVQARELASSGKLPQAIETLEALLAAKPDHGQALIELGEARLASRDPVRARRRSSARSRRGPAIRRGWSGSASRRSRSARTKRRCRRSGARSAKRRAIARSSPRPIAGSASRGGGAAISTRRSASCARRSPKMATMSTRARISARRWSPIVDRTTRRCATSSAWPRAMPHRRPRSTRSVGSR